MPRHGRLLLAAAAIAAAFVLAPATASAAGLIAAYEEYVTGQGFEIRIVNAATGAQLAGARRRSTRPTTSSTPRCRRTAARSSSRACSCSRSSTATSCRRTDAEHLLGQPRRPGRAGRRLPGDGRGLHVPLGDLDVVRDGASCRRAAGRPVPRGHMLVATRHDVPADRREARLPRATSSPSVAAERRPARGVDPEPVHATIFRARPASPATASRTARYLTLSNHDPVTRRDHQERRAALPLRPARRRRLRTAVGTFGVLDVRRQRRPGRAPRAAQRRRLRRDGPGGRRERRHPLDHLPGRDADDGGAGARSPRRARSGCRRGRPTGSSSASCATAAASASSASSTPRPASRPWSTRRSRSARRRRRRRRAPSRTSTAASRSPNAPPSAAPALQLRRDLPRPDSPDAGGLAG